MDFRIEEIVNGILKDEQCVEIIDRLVQKFSLSSIDNALHLFEVNEQCLRSAMQLINNKLSNSHQANYFLINGRKLIANNKNHSDTKFAMLVPVCMYYFPEGYADDRCSLAEKSLFQEFLSLFNDANIFSWDNQNDVSWAKMFNYFDYLKLVQFHNTKPENGTDTASSDES